MPVRASDQITLTVLPAPTYVRMFYLLQSSTLTAPAKPTTNPPQSPWSTVEPSYTEGSTDTLYTVLLTGFGPNAFEYGDVQKSSAFEAAKQAYNMAKAAAAAAASAQSTADGKVTVADAAPVTANGTGKPVGAIWFKRNASNRFDGVWEWTGAAWVTRALDNAVIATLDAAKLTTGILNADRIGANSMSLSKLIVSDLTNHIENPFFDLGMTGWGSTGGSAVAAPFEGHPSSWRIVSSGERTQSPIAVKKGDTWRLSMFYTAAGWPAGGAGGLRLQKSTDNAATWTDFGSTTLGNATVWTENAVEVVIPDGVTHIRARVAFAANGATVTMNGFALRRLMAGSLVVDGTLTARKVNVTEFFADQAVINEATAAVLRSHVIQVDHLSPYLADNLDLSSNGTINLIVSQQVEMSAEISKATDDVLAAQEAAQVAEESAGVAKATADGVSEALKVVDGKTDAVSERLKTVETWFWVDADGAHLGRSDTSFQTNIKPDRFQIANGGIVQTEWTSEGMNVPTATIGSLLLENHQIESYGTGTVIRKL